MSRVYVGNRRSHYSRGTKGDSWLQFFVCKHLLSLFAPGHPVLLGLEDISTQKHAKLVFLAHFSQFGGRLLLFFLHFGNWIAHGVKLDFLVLSVALFVDAFTRSLTLDPISSQETHLTGMYECANQL